MRIFKNFLIYSIFSLSIHANAYVAEYLQQEETAYQIDAVIVLDENGEPRCKITLKEFVEQNPEAEGVLSKLDALEECANGDELYAEFGLGPQEISMAGVPSSNKTLLIGLAKAAGKAWAKSGGPLLTLVSFGYSCAVRKGNGLAALPLFLLGTVASTRYGLKLVEITRLGAGSISLSLLATMFSGFLVAKPVCGQETD